MKTPILFCVLGLLWFGCSQSPVSPGSNLKDNTARCKLADVNSLAESYGEGLRLISVSGSNVNPDGTSGLWSFEYSDTSIPRSSYLFHCRLGAVGIDSAFPTGVDTSFIENDTWFNSDSALGIAEKNGGSDFRTRNPRNTIIASLRNLDGPNPRTMWEITYCSNDSYCGLLVIRIDAISGAIISKYQ